MANKELLAALLGAQVKPEDTLFGTGLDALSARAPQFYNPYMSTGKALGVTLGTGLASALMGHLAKLDAAQQNAEIQPLLVKALGASKPEDLATIMASKHADKLSGIALNAYTTNAENARKEAQNKAELQNNILEKIAVDKNTPAAQKAAIYAQLGVKLPEVAATPESKPIAIQEPQQGKFGEYKPYTTKRDEIIKEGIDLGLTPNKASEEADKRLTQETAANKSINKKIEDSRAESNKMQALAATAEEGIAGAGETGGPAPLAKIRDILSNVYQYAPTEGGAIEKEQRAKTALLDSIKPQIVKANRSPGAVTDYENKMILGAGPSSDKTPAENRSLLNRMENAAKLESDYADFLEEFRQDKGDAIGADKLWNEYKKDVVFKGGKFNSDRISWEEYIKNAKLTKDNKIVKLGSVDDAAKQREAIIAEIRKLEAEQAAGE
jgi:hypothetical protein